MTIDERIERLHTDITRIAQSRGIGPPTTIILNRQGFIDWYRYCQQQDIDHERWRGRQIIIDKTSPCKVAVSYHPDQKLLEKVKD